MYTYMSCSAKKSLAQLFVCLLNSICCVDFLVQKKSLIFCIHLRLRGDLYIYTGCGTNILMLKLDNSSCVFQRE